MGSWRCCLANTNQWYFSLELFLQIQSLDNIIIFFAGLYGTLFRRNKEAAFSNYRLWESLGFVVAYAYSTTLCAEMKCYVLMAVLILGVIGYIIVEVRHKKQVSLTRFFVLKDQNH